MKNENFIVVHGWMVNELHLKGNELLIYALIYGFSQDGESKYRGSINHICCWLNCARNTVIKTIKSLQNKGLVTKHQRVIEGILLNEYSANYASAKNAPLVQKVDEGSAKSELGVVQKVDEPSAKNAPNNNSNNNTNKKRIYGEFKHVKLSDDDISKLKGMTSDVDKWIKRLDEYIENTGKSYKNHCLTIRNWINKEGYVDEKGLPSWYANKPKEKVSAASLAEALELQKRLKGE